MCVSLCVCIYTRRRRCRPSSYNMPIHLRAPVRGRRISPQDTEGVRAFNVRLQEQSDGLLPKIDDPTTLNIATVRCSHTTALLRCLIFPTKSMHKELAGNDGNISTARILEAQPSFRQPMEVGLQYTVIAHELVEACPGLMKFLATTGNAGHHTARVATTVQKLKRVHSIAKKQASFPTLSEKDWNKVKTLVCIGMCPSYKLDIDSYLIGLRQ